jgi:hypothetical protein
MSYGVWKQRGKNWSSIEIDGAGNDAEYQFRSYAERYGESLAKCLKTTAQRHGVPCSTSLWAGDVHDDFHFIRWATSQLKRGWTVYECDTSSDHSLWFSFKDEAGKNAALKAFGDRINGCSPMVVREPWSWLDR